VKPRATCLRAAIVIALLVMLACGAARAQESESQPTATPEIQLGLPPTVSIRALPPYGAAPLTVGFFVNAVDPENAGFVSYRWNFGDGRVAITPPLLTYQTYVKPGNYLATLTVVTSDGRSASAFAGVTVRGKTFGAESSQR
jgi:PKD repeat protein